MVNCYKFHGREDLLPAFSEEDEKANQLATSNSSVASTHVSIITVPSYSIDWHFFSLLVLGNHNHFCASGLIITVFKPPATQNVFETYRKLQNHARHHLSLCLSIYAYNISVSAYISVFNMSFVFYRWAFWKFTMPSINRTQIPIWLSKFMFRRSRQRKPLPMHRFALTQWP